MPYYLVHADDELMHHGIKGMKWGVRHQRKVDARREAAMQKYLSESKRYRDEATKESRIAKNTHFPRLLKKVHHIGKEVTYRHRSEYYKSVVKDNGKVKHFLKHPLKTMRQLDYNMSTGQRIALSYANAVVPVVAAVGVSAARIAVQNAAARGKATREARERIPKLDEMINLNERQYKVS